MDVMRGHLVLFSVPVMIADFSGAPGHCNPKPIVFSKPQSGCVYPPTRDQLEFEPEGKYVVVDRGDCSFAAKGANAEEIGASGLIIINTQNRIVEMPTDPQLISHNLKIPVVMISKGSANDIVHAMGSEHSGKLTARLAITAQCLKNDAGFHKKFSEEYEEEVREAERVERKVVNEVRTQVNALGMRTRKLNEPVDSRDSLSEYSSTQQFTQRDKIPAEVAVKLREDENILSGEMILGENGEPAWGVEFLAVAVGGYLPPQERTIEVVVVGEEDVVNCRTPQPKYERAVQRDRKDRAILWKHGNEARCKEWELVELAHRLHADVLLLYGEDGDRGTEFGWVDDFIPKEAEGAEIEIEYATHLDPAFNELVETQFKTSVVTCSAAAAKLFTARLGDEEAKSQTLTFRGDNFVELAWADVNALRDPSSWPHTDVQRRRLLNRMIKTYGTIPERKDVLQESYNRAERMWQEWGRRKKEEDAAAEVPAVAAGMGRGRHEL
jgi:hypothetical protein